MLLKIVALLNKKKKAKILKRKANHQKQENNVSIQLKLWLFHQLES